MYQCPKCLRHPERIKVLKVDPKTKKKWYVLTCPACNYESDIEEYKSSRNYSGKTNFNPSSIQGFDEDWPENNDSEGL